MNANTFCALQGADSQFLSQEVHSHFKMSASFIVGILYIRDQLLILPVDFKRAIIPAR